MSAPAEARGVSRRRSPHTWVVALVLTGAAPGYAQPAIDVTDSASEDPRAHSRREFELGARALEGGRAFEARSHFERAYALFPHPATLYNIALAERALGRPVQVIDALERYLSDAPPDARERSFARQVLDEARARVAKLTVSVKPASARLTVDGEPALQGTAVRVNPGARVVRLTADGYRDEQRQLTIDGGAEVRLTITLERRPLPPRPEARAPTPRASALDDAFWSVTIASGALAAAGAVMGIVALSDARAHNDAATAPDEAARRRSRGEVLRVAADISFGLALAGGATAVVLATREPSGAPAASFGLGGAWW